MKRKSFRLVPRRYISTEIEEEVKKSIEKGYYAIVSLKYEIKVSATDGELFTLQCMQEITKLAEKTAKTAFIFELINEVEQ